MAVRPSQYWPVLLGISLFAGVAGFRWASSGKGGIVLTVNARDGAPVRGITAFVDGALVACDFSPCTISEQASRIHAVKVVVPGFVAPPQLGVEVRPRTNVPANFQLDPSPRALKVSAAPAGAKLYLDGKEIGELPQEIHDLALGAHIVRVAAGDAYEPVERRIELEPDKTVELAFKLCASMLYLTGTFSHTAAREREARCGSGPAVWGVRGSLPHPRANAVRPLPLLRATTGRPGRTLA